MVKTEGLVYFSIKTDDDTMEEESINSFIGLKATRFTKKFSYGKTPVCTIWERSTNKIINPDMKLLIDRVLGNMIPYKERFVRFKEQHPECTYILEIVIYHGDNAEGFCINNEQLSFLSEIGAFVDVDQYNYKL